MTRAQTAPGPAPADGPPPAGRSRPRPPGAPAPASLLPVGLIVLVWSSFLTVDLALTHLVAEPYLSRLGVDAEHIALVRAMPAWMFALGATGSLCSGAGAVLLLMRRAGAAVAFVLSGCTVLIGIVHAYALSDIGSRLGAGGGVLQGVAAAQALGLIWYARRLARLGVLT